MPRVGVPTLGVQRGFSGGNKYDKNSWVNKMLVSYFDIINNDFDATSKAAFLPILQARLQPDYVDSVTTGYLYNTFGPSGQNKTVCDFIAIFNTTKATALTTRANTKTGATMRWNFSGTIYSQNNLPAQIASDGFITVSSIDGFAAWTVINFQNNNFRYNFPFKSFLGAKTTLRLDFNAFNNNLTNYQLQACAGIYLNNCQFTGNISNWIINATITGINAAFNTGIIGAAPQVQGAGALNYQFNSCGLTANNSSTYRTSMSQLFLYNNAIPTAQLDTLLNNLKVFYAANAPAVNLTVRLEGTNMGIPTGGSSNADIVALLDIFTAVGKVFTIVVRTS